MGRKGLFLGLAGFLALMALTAWGLWRSEAFWHLCGRMLLSFAESRLQGEIQIGSWEGHPLTGLTLRKVVVKTKGGYLLDAAQAKLRLSPWSLVTRQPVVSYLELVEPCLTLPGEGLEGIWGPAAWKPEASHSLPLAFKSLTLSEVVVQGGRVLFRHHGEKREVRGLMGQLTLTWLNPGQPQEMLLLRRAWVKAATPWGPASASGRLTLNRKTLNLLSLAVEVRDRTWISLSGELHFDENGPRVFGQGEIGPLVGEDLRVLAYFWPASWGLKGRFSVNGPLSQLQFKLEGRVDEGSFSLEGQLGGSASGWQVRINLGQSHLPPGLLTPINPEWARKLAELGPIRLKGVLAVSGKGWSWERGHGQFTCDPLRWGNRQLDHLELKIGATPGHQEMEATARGNFGRLALSLKGPLLASLQGELHLHGEGLRPHLLGLPGEAEDRFTGNFQGTFRLLRWPLLKELVLAGDLKGSGRVGGYPLGVAQVRLEWEKGRWNVARGEVTWGNLKAVVKGSITPEGWDLEGEGQLISGIPGPFLENLSGQLKWQGKLSGSPNAPRLTLQAQGHRLRGLGFSLEGLTLSASLEGWPFKNGNLHLEGRGWQTPLGTWDQTAFSTQGTQGEWHFRLKARSSQGDQAELAGTAPWGVRPLKVLIERARLQKNQVTVENAKPFHIRMLPGLELEGADFRINEGRLHLQARLRPEGVSGWLTAENIPADILAVKGHPLEGKLRGQASLGGEARRPTIKGEFSLSPGRLGEFRFQTLAGSFEYQAQWLTLKGYLEQRTEGPRLTLDGRVPLTLSLIPFNWGWGKDDLKLRLTGDRTDLALLKALTPEVLAASGPVNLEVEWQGPASRPQISGQVRWGEGSLKFRQAGTAYRLRPGVILLAGDRLVIPQLVMESRGTATISGEVRLAGFKMDQVNLKAELQDFQALARAGSEARGNGQVLLKGNHQDLTLTGRLKVTQASFRSIFFAPGVHEDIVVLRPKAPTPAVEVSGPDLAGELMNRLRMDLTLESGGNVWVRDPQFRVEVAGALRATKRPGEAILISGQLRSLQGSINIQDRAFKIEEGTLTFPGTPKAPATLAGRAVYEMSDVTLVLNLSGPTTSPILQYSSIPPLPPSDVLAYLLFGRPVSTLTREEYQVVSPQALGALGGLAAKKLQNFLGKGFPLLGDITFKGDTERVGISKPLTKDLSISLERKVNPLSRDDENQIRLEYRINRRLGVESQMGKRNSGADVIFNFDF